MSFVGAPSSTICGPRLCNELLLANGGGGNELYSQGVSSVYIRPVNVNRTYQMKRAAAVGTPREQQQQQQQQQWYSARVTEAENRTSIPEGMAVATAIETQQTYYPSARPASEIRSAEMRSAEMRPSTTVQSSAVILNKEESKAAGRWGYEENSISSSSAIIAEPISSTSKGGVCGGVGLQWFSCSRHSGPSKEPELLVNKTGPSCQPGDARSPSLSPSSSAIIVNEKGYDAEANKAEILSVTSDGQLKPSSCVSCWPGVSSGNNDLQNYRLRPISKTSAYREYEGGAEYYEKVQQLGSLANYSPVVTEAHRVTPFLETDEASLRKSSTFSGEPATPVGAMGGTTGALCSSSLIDHLRGKKEIAELRLMAEPAASSLVGKQECYSATISGSEFRDCILRPSSEAISGSWVSKHYSFMENHNLGIVFEIDRGLLRSQLIVSSGSYETSAFQVIFTFIGQDMPLTFVDSYARLLSGHNGDIVKLSEGFAMKVIGDKMMTFSDLKYILVNLTSSDNSNSLCDRGLNDQIIMTQGLARLYDNSQKLDIIGDHHHHHHHDHLHIHNPKDFCEISIKCGNSTFLGSRALMMASSPIFGKMLEDKYKATISVKKSSPLLVKEMLDYIHKATCSILEKSKDFDLVAALALLEFSSKFQVTGLTHSLSLRCAERLTPANLQQIYISSEKVRNPFLTEACRRYAKSTRRVDLEKLPEMMSLKYTPVSAEIMRRESQSSSSSSSTSSLLRETQDLDIVDENLNLKNTLVMETVAETETVLIIPSTSTSNIITSTTTTKNNNIYLPSETSSSSSSSSSSNKIFVETTNAPIILAADDELKITTLKSSRSTSSLILDVEKDANIKHVDETRILTETLQEPMGAPLQEPMGAPLQEPMGAPLQEPMGAPLQEPMGVAAILVVSSLDSLKDVPPEVLAEKTVIIQQPPVATIAAAPPPPAAAALVVSSSEQQRGIINESSSYVKDPVTGQPIAVMAAEPIQEPIQSDIIAAEVAAGAASKSKKKSHRSSSKKAGPVEKAVVVEKVVADSKPVPVSSSPKAKATSPKATSPKATSTKAKAPAVVVVVDKQTKGQTKGPVVVVADKQTKGPVVVVADKKHHHTVKEEVEKKKIEHEIKKEVKKEAKKSKH